MDGGCAAAGFLFGSSPLSTAVHTIPTIEPAWHRKQRRQRTGAKARLLGFLKGAWIPRARIIKDCEVLRLHHSRSTLPDRAARRLVQLGGRAFTVPASLDMSAAWCGTCEANRAKKATFCPQCGTQLVVYTQQPSSSPWSGDGWGRSESPRRRQSPRRKTAETNARSHNSGSWAAESPRGKGKGGKQRQDSAKGKGAKALEAPPGDWRPPSIAAAEMPLPPQLPQGLAKPAPVSAATTSSADRAALESLVAALAVKKDELPLSVQELLATHQQGAAQDQAKLLHRSVTAQQKAKIELAKIQSARLQYLNGWCNYLGQLSDLLQKQSEAQTATLQDLAEKELQWTSSLQEANRALQTQIIPESADNMEDKEAVAAMEDAAEARVADTITLERALQAQREQQEQATSALLAAVQTAKEKAGTEAAAAAAKERDRTPRRRKNAETVIDVEAVPGEASG